MFCKNCGNEIENGALFCSACGQRADTAQNVYEEPIAPEKPITAENNTGILTAPEQTFVQPIPVMPAIPAAEPRRVKKVKEEKPKTFFGKGALALCLAIIALLSASTGMFAYLYFALAGRLM